jgi:citrate lyase beta subunit
LRSPSDREDRLASLRSLLFAPGAEERKLAKAFSAGADGVIVDLEDSVAPESKETARALVERSLAEAPSACLRLLRINAVDTEFFPGDLALLARLDLDAIVLPKATPDAVAALDEVGAPLIAIVESALGLQSAGETAAHPHVAALVLGAADLGAELGLEPREDELEILYARSKLVVDSAAAGIRPAIDVAHLDIRDLEGLERSARLARSLGLRGKLCIHPGQVAVVNAVFTPTAAELDWARSVVEAYEEAMGEGRGVLALEGRMIDAPVVARARRVLAEAHADRDG